MAQAFTMFMEFGGGVKNYTNIGGTITTSIGNTYTVPAGKRLVVKSTFWNGSAGMSGFATAKSIAATGNLAFGNLPNGQATNSSFVIPAGEVITVDSNFTYVIMCGFIEDDV